VPHPVRQLPVLPAVRQRGKGENYKQKEKKVWLPAKKRYRTQISRSLKALLRIFWLVDWPELVRDLEEMKVLDAEAFDSIAYRNGTFRPVEGLPHQPRRSIWLKTTER
jgi:hypothetical protein